MAQTSLFFTDRINLTYELPMTPEEFTVSSDGGNTKVDVVNLGEILRLSPATSLQEVNLTLNIPVDLSRRRAYWTGKKLRWTGKTGGNNYVKLLKDWHINKEVLRVVLTNTPFNDLYVIDGFTSGFKDGNVDEWVCELKLVAWRSYKPKVLATKEVADKVRIRTATARTNPAGKIGVGSSVILNGRVYADSYGNGGGMTFTNRKMVVTLVAPGRAMPYNVGPAAGQYTGWVRAQDVRLR